MGFYETKRLITVVIKPATGPHPRILFITLRSSSIYLNVILRYPLRTGLPSALPFQFLDLNSVCTHVGITGGSEVKITRSGVAMIT